MINVVVIAKDDRVRRLVEIHLRELEMEDLRFATFRSQNEFQDLYFKDPKPEPEPAEQAEGAEPEKPAEEESADLKLFNEVHLLIFALDTIDGKAIPWMDRLRTNMKRYKRLPENTPMRMVMLKYEDDGVSKLDVMHPALDDLIYLPLDRLVFLQKMQIIITLPKKATPTFLFNQEVRLPIEISKITKLDRLSDVALAIRNPVPLKPGLPGHFYLQLTGEKTILELQAKVLRSLPHPDYPGQYLVYFTYFGLSKNDLSTIRRSLSKSPSYKSLKNDDREKYRYHDDDLFLADNERQHLGIVVIDTDETSATSISQSLTKEMDRLFVSTESSFVLFAHRYLKVGGSSGAKTPPKATDASDFYASPISMTIGSADLRCMSVDPGPSNDVLFLGHSAAGVFSSPDKWLSLIQEKESKILIEEAIQLVNKGRVIEKLLVVNDQANTPRAVRFKFYRGSSEGTVTIEFHPASLSDIVERMSSEQASKQLDGMLIDTSFVPDEPSEWLSFIRTQAMTQGLIPQGKQLKFWLLGESERIDPRWLNNSEILGLFIKPVDQRQLLFSMAEHLPNHNTMYQFDNLGWTQPNLNLHVAKDVELEALSEFGATLKTKQKLVPGTMIYLRKSIYENAPNRCLAARVYACDEHPSDKEYFQIMTTYFGINDAFLKFARTWIRENYAHQKEQSQG